MSASPADKLAGLAEMIAEERDRKLEQARACLVLARSQVA